MEGTSGFMKKFNIVEVSIISLFWILLFASPLLPGLLKEGIDWTQVTKVWKERSVLLALFFVNRFVLVPFLLFRHKRVFYILAVLFLIGTAVTGMYISTRKPEPASKSNRKPPQTEINPIRKERNPNNPMPPRIEPGRRQPENTRPEPIPAYVNMLIFSVLLFGFDTGLKAASKLIYSEQQRIMLEKENIETQLAFLRHQIHPHFFMNTLNNIHSLIDINTIEAKKSIIKLSNLMRHLLYESNQELSPLKNEVDFLNNYVELMRLRYSEEVRITLSIPVHIPDKSIPPLLFISLLENAFKHGISYMQESFVQIELSFEPDKIHLKITNSKKKEKVKYPFEGIGIENTRKRLNLLYNKNYSLDFTDNGDSFVTNLIIPV